jgi:hypothetical protein
VVSINNIQNDEQAKGHGVELGSSLLTYDFVLVQGEAAARLRRLKAEKAMAGLGHKCRVIGELLVPDVDYWSTKHVSRFLEYYKKTQFLLIMICVCYLSFLRYIIDVKSVTGPSS